MLMFTADQIRELRFSMRMTPAEFAGKLGVTENAVRMWEAGTRHPRIKSVFALNDMKAKVDEKAAKNRKTRRIAVA